MIKHKLCLFTALLGGSLNNFAIKNNSPEDKKPNIIIIVADDLGWGDVGFHGSAIKTPNLDHFSEQGIQFSRFYTAPICSPTRAGLLTGMYPNRFGIRESVIPPWRDFGLDTATVTIPEFLKNNGYSNRAIIGKWHLGHSRPEYYPLNNGFTHFYGHLNGAIDYFTHIREGELDWHNDYASCYDQGYSTDLIAEESVKCIKNYQKEGPFFLYVAFNAPHTPLQAKPEDLKLYEQETFPNENTNAKGKKKTDNPRKTYAAMVTCLDRGIGMILQTLNDLNIAENTLVLFLSDNGADEASGGGTSGILRGHKFMEFDGGVRSPAIISWPGKLQGHRTIGQLTGFVDVFPTICDIVSPTAQTPAAFDGISILSILNGTKKNIDRTFYLGCGALINNEWKIIRSGQNPQMGLNHDVLFHISEDQSEEKDLSAIKPEIKERLTQQVLKYDSVKPNQELLPFNSGKEGFIAPKEWNIFNKK